MTRTRFQTHDLFRIWVLVYHLGLGHHSRHGRHRPSRQHNNVPQKTIRTSIPTSWLTSAMSAGHPTASCSPPVDYLGRAPEIGVISLGYGTDGPRPGGPVSWSPRAKSAQSLALRSRIVLTCADGQGNKDVAARLGSITAEQVEDWWWPRWSPHQARHPLVSGLDGPAQRGLSKSTIGRIWKVFEHPLFPANGGSLHDIADFASRCGPNSCSTPPRPRPLNRTRGFATEDPGISPTGLTTGRLPRRARLRHTTPIIKRPGYWTHADQSSAAGLLPSHHTAAWLPPLVAANPATQPRTLTSRAAPAPRSVSCPLRHATA